MKVRRRVISSGMTIVLAPRVKRAKAKLGQHQAPMIKGIDDRVMHMLMIISPRVAGGFASLSSSIKAYPLPDFGIKGAC